MTAMTRKRTDAGFTLLEMLLALALLALIVSSLLGGLHLGRRAFEAGRGGEANSEIEAAAAALSDLLAQTFPATVSDPDKGSVAVFSGRPNGCFFTALSEGRTQMGGLVSTEIGLQNRSGHNDLAVWSKVFRAGAVAATRREDMRETRLVSNVTSFGMAYFGVVEDGRPPEWRDEWLLRDRLPKLVSVHFASERAGKRYDVAFSVVLRQE